MTDILKEFRDTVSSIFTGMGVTWRHLFKKSVTIQYPDQKMDMPPGVRHKLHVNIDDCIGCRLCEKACPVNCIEIGTVKSTEDDDLGATSNGQKKRLWVTNFEIDMAKCMYCDLCVPPCPTECIYMVEDYEYSMYNRDHLKFQFSDMTTEKVEEVTKKAEEEAERKKAEKEREAAKKKAEKEKKAAASATEDKSEAKSEEKQSSEKAEEKKPKARPARTSRPSRPPRKPRVPKSDKSEKSDKTDSKDQNKSETDSNEDKSNE